MRVENEKVVQKLWQFEVIYLSLPDFIDIYYIRCGRTRKIVTPPPRLGKVH